MDTVRAILAAKGADVVSIGPEATVIAALEKMAERNIGAILVREGEGEVQGIFSERDFARKIIVKGRSCDGTKVREIMTTSIVFAKPETSVEDCMNLMTTHKFRHLPIKDGKLVVGVVSIGDVVKAMLEHKEKIISQQAFEIGQNERKTGGAI